MTYSEVVVLSDPYSIEAATPFGKIINREQYDYMIAFEKRSKFGFYWTDDDRHIPTYEECIGKYLYMISFFGGASFYLTIRDKYYKWNGHNVVEVDQEWNYGKYGKLELDK